MLETVILLCNFVTKNDIAVIKEAELLGNNRILCDTNGNQCGSALLVLFKDEKAAQVVYENDCLYVRKENK
jgi:hypothetical protein